MTWDAFVPSLMFMTIGAVLILAILSFAVFLSKRRNRRAAERAFSGNEAAPDRRPPGP